MQSDRLQKEKKCKILRVKSEGQCAVTRTSRLHTDVKFSRYLTGISDRFTFQCHNIILMVDRDTVRSLMLDAVGHTFRFRWLNALCYLIADV